VKILNINMVVYICGLYCGPIFNICDQNQNLKHNMLDYLYQFF
jgi:hypothetical protein